MTPAKQLAALLQIGSRKLVLKLPVSETCLSSQTVRDCLHHRCGYCCLFAHFCFYLLSLGVAYMGSLLASGADNYGSAVRRAAGSVDDYLSQELEKNEYL
jgi:hypothetical protein